MFAAPVSVPACYGIGGVWSLLCRLQQVLNAVIPVLVALGVVYLVWGIVQYFIGDSDEAKKKGKDRIMYGIIGLAVIISVWGLVYILVDTFGTEYTAPPNQYFQDLLPR